MRATFNHKPKNIKIKKEDIKIKLSEKVPNDWKDLLKTEFQMPWFNKLAKTLEKAYETETIYPKKTQIFRALELTSFKDCKVIIMGQDPYHAKGQANGLAFSVNKTIKTPPSLKNILKEVENTTRTRKNDGDLTSWAKQGVLLINSILTVKANTPQSHSKIGWQQFTDKIIKLLNNKKSPIAFLLWGNFAKSKEKLINNPTHLILHAAHPSPLSAHNGFFGCNHFNLVNKFLINTNQTPIDWSA